MKKILVVLTVAFLFTLTLGSQTFAEEVQPPQMQTADTATFSSIAWSNQLATSSFQISYVDSTISKVSSTSVKVSASTEANSTADDIGGTITIQRWKDNQWSSYKTVSFYGFDRDSYSTTKTVSIASGYSYRLSVYHTASLGSSSDSVRSTTNSILVQ